MRVGSVLGRAGPRTAWQRSGKGFVVRLMLPSAHGFDSRLRYLTAGVRESISDFGPPAVIMGLSAISLLPAMRALGTFSRISMPGGA